MTAVGRGQPAAGAGVATLRERGGAGRTLVPTLLVVRWSVSREALVGGGHQAASSAAAINAAAGDEELELRWVIVPGPEAGEDGQARAVLTRCSAGLGSAEVMVADVRGGGEAVEVVRVGEEGDRLVHAEVRSGSVVLFSATVRVHPDGRADVLYARTNLLAELGLKGGRYEVAGGLCGFGESAER